jgi:hypothetical protein
MTPADLIRPTDPGYDHSGPFKIVEDFRADFPATDAEYGNNTIAAELRDALPTGPASRLVIDSEFSALFVYGERDDLQVALNALQGLKAVGFGQHRITEEPKLTGRLTIGQRAAQDRLQDFVATLVEEGHDPDDITDALRRLSA